MALQIHSGGLLIDTGSLAVHADCCCPAPPPGYCGCEPGLAVPYTSVTIEITGVESCTGGGAVGNCPAAADWVNATFECPIIDPPPNNCTYMFIDGSPFCASGPANYYRIVIVKIGKNGPDPYQNDGSVKASLIVSNDAFFLNDGEFCIAGGVGVGDEIPNARLTDPCTLFERYGTKGKARLVSLNV